MSLKIYIYNEEGELIYIGYVNDEEAGVLTRNKRFNLEVSRGVLYVHIIGDK